MTQPTSNGNSIAGFASYVPYSASAGTGGIGPLGTTGYAAYDSTSALNGTNQPTWNVNSNAVITGSNTIYSLLDRIPTFTNATDMVNLVSGGWIIADGARGFAAHWIAAASPPVEPPAPAPPATSISITTPIAGPSIRASSITPAAARSGWCSRKATVIRSLCQ